jgi:hypothetical protein
MNQLENTPENKPKHTWMEISDQTLPHDLQIVEWKYKDGSGIETGNLVPYYDPRCKFIGWFVHPSDDSADIWLGDFSHYRKIHG